MKGSLLQEYEIMQNPALGANAIWAFTQGFFARPPEELRSLTLWHLVTILPLIYHDTSRNMILKKREASGLRSILERDSKRSIAQNETVFNINNRIKALEGRTFRSLNLALACNIVELGEGHFFSNVPFKIPNTTLDESKDILKAANKLGRWAGGMSDFEYLTILGVDF
jgi:Family of unknown function (DUF6521)